VLRPYAHKFSPKLYTQPQWFVCLVLKTFFKTDYRGIATLLHDLTDLRRTVGLRCVPHFTTIHKASLRLLRVPRARHLLRATIRRHLGRRWRMRRAAFDSTGLDCGQRSYYYVRRRSATSKRWQRVTYSPYAKLELAVDTVNHLVIGCLVGRGPRPDTNRYVPLLKATPWATWRSMPRWPMLATTPSRITSMPATARASARSCPPPSGARPPSCPRDAIAAR
jgi:hypothetical protein